MERLPSYWFIPSEVDLLTLQDTVEDRSKNMEARCRAAIVLTRSHFRQGELLRGLTLIRKVGASASGELQRARDHITGELYLARGRLTLAERHFRYTVAQKKEDSESYWLAAAGLVVTQRMRHECVPAFDTARAQPSHTLAYRIVSGARSPEGMQELRAEANHLGLHVLACRAARYACEERLENNDLRGASSWLDNAKVDAERCANATELCFVAYLELKIEHERRGLKAEHLVACEALLTEASARSDTFAQAQIHYLLALAYSSAGSETAVHHLRSATDLCDACHFVSLYQECRALGAAWGLWAMPTGAFQVAFLPVFQACVNVGVQQEPSDLRASIAEVLSLARVSAMSRPTLAAVLEPAVRQAGLRTLRAGLGGAWLVDLSNRMLFKGDDKPLSFGRAAVQLEVLLILLKEGSIARDVLFERVWEQPYREETSKNTLNVTLNRLRKRLKLPEPLWTSQGGQLSVLSDVALYCR